MCVFISFEVYYKVLHYVLRSASYKCNNIREDASAKPAHQRRETRASTKELDKKKSFCIVIP